MRLAELAFLLNSARHVHDHAWLDGMLRASLDKTKEQYTADTAFTVGNSQSNNPWMSNSAKSQGVFRAKWTELKEKREDSQSAGHNGGGGIGAKVSTRVAIDTLLFVLGLELHLCSNVGQPVQQGEEDGSKATRMLVSTATIASDSFAKQMQLLYQALKACQAAAVPSDRGRWDEPLQNAKSLAKCKRVRHLTLFAR